MAETRIVQYHAGVARGYRTAVSLHSHTHHSMEYLDFLPGWTERLPVVSGLVRREIVRRRRRLGRPLDFSRAYWRPPLSPRAVLESELGQIAERCGTAGLVSITDHDSIDAGLALNALDAQTPHPVSVEWTVPFAGTTFHLGIHNLPRGAAQAALKAMHACTADATTKSITDILAWLDREPSVLTVLNHPLWNAKHDLNQNHTALGEFVSRFRAFLHATEVNGYRSHAENADVVALGRAWDLPVLAGGDRHGRAPNAMVNLTGAGTFDDFVVDLRCERRAVTLVFPEYREHPTTRVLETVGDVLRHDDLLDPDRQRWSDRVFVVRDDGSHVPLSALWTTGVPWWIRASVGTARLLGSRQARRALRLRFAPEAGGIV